MSIQSVTLTLKVKKTGGVDLVLGAGGLTQLTGTAATRSLAEAAIQSQLDSTIATAQGNVQDLTDANSAFNS